MVKGLLGRTDRSGGSAGCIVFRKSVRFQCVQFAFSCYDESLSITESNEGVESQRCTARRKNKTQVKGFTIERFLVIENEKEEEERK